MTMTTTRYVSCADTAKLIRSALKREFPGVRFSVRSSVYSGGASIDVRWTDGPVSADVSAVTGQYAGGRFDGMIDLAYSVSHYLRPDGRVMLARDPGTYGNRGLHPPTDNTDLAPVLPHDAELVHFGADYVFCTRQISDETTKRAAARAWILAHCVTTGEGTAARFGDQWVDDLATGLVYGARDGESIESAFERRAWYRS